jgi:hypothetical protein
VEEYLKLAYLENCALSAMFYSDDVPISYCDAEDKSDRMELRNAINEELEALVENKTWEIVILPEGRKQSIKKENSL